MNFNERLINSRYKLSEAETSLAVFIAHNLSSTSSFSIEKLAKTNFTVPNTVTRLCKKLGYSGYAELRIEFRNIKKIKDAKQNFISEKQLIEHTFDLIDASRNQNIVSKMIKAEKIILFAVGETSFPVHDFANTINSLNHKTVFYTYENQIINEFQSSKNILTILVSLSGENEHVLQIAKIAKQNQQFIVSLTHLSNNTLQRMSDIQLFCYSPNRQVYGINLTDKAPLYLILNALQEQYLQETCKNTQI
ncbi:MAG: MurR/RpiR family transcriptional regulator [Oenococcus sp.]|uniref:MurR/RpiR family transcriptional regulator n=1 Tax=Oenococcus TaxID=46254 RepID=UPI0021E92D40|nr:MurR/RpiR family transcriptional regulator [Oenococcus kitaharae]MCV3296585.1 MurR/RpiR family transcriptional regulator [Oenococcus kitaharae]